MNDLRFVEPSAAELHAIEVEWPVIAAELAVVDAECRHAACPSSFTLRLVRRAEQRLAEVIREHANTTVPVRSSNSDAA